LHGLVFRNIPAVRNPEQLIALQLPTSYPHYERYRGRTDIFSSTFAYVAPVPFEIEIGRRAERKWGHLVTRSYFSTLSVSPALGRFFGTEDEATHASSVVVSYRFFQDYLQGNPAAIGKRLQINGYPFTVIGVGPEHYLGASPVIYGADVWMPVWVSGRIAPELANRALKRHELTLFHVVGRLRPGVTAGQAEAALDATARQLEQDYQDVNQRVKSRRVLLVQGGKELPVRKQDLPFFTEFFTVLGGMVLLIACSNLGNMMLARGMDRRREIAIRFALGAGRVRVMRQLLTESMLIACGAGVLGFCLALWVMRGASSLRIPYPIPVTLDLNPDVGALLFTLGLVVFAGLALGLVPAWQVTRRDLTPALNEGGNLRLQRLTRLNLRTVLMVSQVAGSVALPIMTGYLVLG